MNVSFRRNNNLSASSIGSNFPWRRCLGMALCLALVPMLWASSARAAGDGAKIYNDLVEKDEIYPDEEWQNYVTQIGERLLAVSPHAGRNYTFTVTDQTVFNAFATGDAYIFVTRGIMVNFNSEDELAYVLGHEIGHVVGGHIQKRKRGVFLSKALGLLGTFATGTSATYGLSQTLANASLSGYGREAELEADRFGAQFMVKAGYNPHASINSVQMMRNKDDFQRSVKNQPVVYHGTSGSHPANEKRLHEVVQMLQTQFPEELLEPERDFHAMMNGFSFGDDSATGIVKDGVYYHGQLRLIIKFPAQWDVRSSPTEVFALAPTAGPMGKITVRPQSPPDEAQTPLEYLQKTLRRDDLEGGEEIQVGPYTGYLASVKIASGTAVKRKIAVVYKDAGVYLFNGELGAGGDPVAFERDFRDTVMSMRAMTAADLRLVNNQKIKVIVAQPGQTYAELAKGVPIKVYAEETLRMINGHHPRGEPRAGDYVKIVE